jgi:hypothetical protein
MQIDEKALSKAQQRFMGMVYATKSGEMKAPSPEVAFAAAGMTTKQAKDFAKTKHKGLPEKKVSEQMLPEPTTEPVNSMVDKKTELLDKSKISNLKMIQQKKQQIDRQKLQMQKSGKLPLEASYQPEGEQISEKKSQEKKKRPNANTHNPTYANPQTDTNSLSGSGGSRVRTSDKDWDE